MERAPVARGRPVLHGALFGAGTQRDVFRRHPGVSRAVPVVVAGSGRTLRGPRAQGRDSLPGGSGPTDRRTRRPAGRLGRPALTCSPASLSVDGAVLPNFRPTGMPAH